MTISPAPATPTTWARAGIGAGAVGLVLLTYAMPFSASHRPSPCRS